MRTLIMLAAMLIGTGLCGCGAGGGGMVGFRAGAGAGGAQPAPAAISYYCSKCGGSYERAGNCPKCGLELKAK